MVVFVIPVLNETDAQSTPSPPICSKCPFLCPLFLPVSAPTGRSFRSPDVDDCHVIANDKSTEFILATVVEEAGK